MSDGTEVSRVVVIVTPELADRIEQARGEYQRVDGNPTLSRQATITRLLTEALDARGVPRLVANDG